MFSSVCKTVVLTMAVATSVAAHTTFTNFYVNGVDQGDGTCVRMNDTPMEATFPVEDVTSSDMVCGFNGLTPVSRVCPVSDGATLTFEFRARPYEPNTGSQIAIDPGHVGPCAVYLKKVDSSAEATGEGDGWFKIFDDGYDASTGQWCNDKINANDNRLSVKLPQGLAGGYYLARPEMLALHQAVDHIPQFYTGCAQIFLESTGSVVPNETVSIPGYVSMSDPGLNFNVYEKPMALPYPIPGPIPADYEKADLMAASVAKQTEGLEPAGCILENANWCGVEVPSYTDEAGCWDSQKNCWSQDHECWLEAPATGGANCKIWEDKCRGIMNNCKAGLWTGPPNKGMVLTPKQLTIDIGSIMPTSPGGLTIQPSATPAPGHGGGDDGSSASSVSSTEATPTQASSNAPRPSAHRPTHAGHHGPPAITVVETVVVTDIVYETIAAKPRKRAPVYRQF